MHYHDFILLNYINKLSVESKVGLGGIFEVGVRSCVHTPRRSARLMRRPTVTSWTVFRAGNLIFCPVTMWRSIGMLFYRELHATMRTVFSPANPDPRIIDGHVARSTGQVLRSYSITFRSPDAPTHRHIMDSLWAGSLILCPITMWRSIGMLFY
jgi:hypothetical protein